MLSQQELLLQKHYAMVDRMVAEPDRARSCRRSSPTSQQLVAAWALPTEKARYFKLLERTVEELRPFYDAMLPRSPAIIGLPFEARPAP